MWIALACESIHRDELNLCLQTERGPTARDLEPDYEWAGPNLVVIERRTDGKEVAIWVAGERSLRFLSCE